MNRFFYNIIILNFIIFFPNVLMVRADSGFISGGKLKSKKLESINAAAANIKLFSLAKNKLCKKHGLIIRSQKAIAKDRYYYYILNIEKKKQTRIKRFPSFKSSIILKHSDWSIGNNTIIIFDENNKIKQKIQELNFLIKDC